MNLNGLEMIEKWNGQNCLISKKREERKERKKKKRKKKGGSVGENMGQGGKEGTLKGYD
jgi:hypothetical protein